MLKLELVLDDPDETVIPLTEAEYLAENGDDPECVAALEEIKSGSAEVMMGGGAMPITILRKAHAPSIAEGILKIMRGDSTPYKFGRTNDAGDSPSYRSAMTDAGRGRLLR